MNRIATFWALPFLLPCWFFSPKAAAGVVLGPDGVMVYRQDIKDAQAEFQLLPVDRNAEAKSFNVVNVRGVLVLDLFERIGFDNWRTTIPLGTVDASNGKVSLFDGISVKAVDGKMQFSTVGSSYPLLNPSLDGVRPGAESINRFRAALGAALVQQTLSERGVDLQGVGAEFVQNYMKWRGQLNGELQARFDRMVFEGFAQSGFAAIFRDGKPFLGAGLELLQIGSTDRVFDELKVEVKVAAAKFLEEVKRTNQSDFLDRGRAEDFVKKHSEALTNLTSKFSVLGCKALEAGFR